MSYHLGWVHVSCIYNKYLKNETINRYIINNRHAFTILEMFKLKILLYMLADNSDLFRDFNSEALFIHIKDLTSLISKSKSSLCSFLNLSRNIYRSSVALYRQLALLVNLLQKFLVPDKKS